MTILVDINRYQLNSSNNNLRNILLLNGLRNIINDLTRVTARTSTLLDPIVISNNLTVLTPGIHCTPKEISDHFGTNVFMKSSHLPSTPYKRCIWNYKRADFVKFNALISTTDLYFLNLNTIDEACDLFTKMFHNFAQQCIPTNLSSQ
jgi:hypothetical protein